MSTPDAVLGPIARRRRLDAAEAAFRAAVARRALPTFDAGADGAAVERAERHLAAERLAVMPPGRRRVVEQLTDLALDDWLDAHGLPRAEDLAAAYPKTGRSFLDRARWDLRAQLVEALHGDHLGPPTWSTEDEPPAVRR